MTVQKPYGIVFTGGDEAPPERILPLVSGSDLLIAADSGYDSCKRLGIVPQVVLGDFDSMEDPHILAQPAGVEVIRYSTEKDFSDTFMAVDLANRRVGKAILSGGGGGLLDHLLGNLSLFYHSPSPILWITSKEYVFLASAQTHISGQPGDRISVIPLEPTSIDSEGLEWELTNLSLSPNNISLSNRFRRAEVRMSILRGRALVILPFTGTFIPQVDL